MRIVKKVLLLVGVFALVAMAGSAPFSNSSSAYAGDEKIQLNIKGMTDYASTIKIKDALTAVKGVKKAYVDFRNERAIVTVKEDTDHRALIGAVKKAGFTAYLAEDVKVGKKKEEEDEDPYKDFERDKVIGSDSRFE